MTLDNNEKIGKASGFMVSLDDKTYLITNKHVIENIQEITIWLHLVDDADEPLDGHYEHTFRLTKENLFLHPNKNVDLCGIYIDLQNIMNSGKSQGFNIKICSIPEILICKDHSFPPVQEILMIGYLPGLFDDNNYLPVIRKGITATPINRNFKGNQEFLIDCGCYPGYSGSPIIVLEKQHGFHNLHENKFYKNAYYMLIGIQFNSPIGSDNQLLDTNDEPILTRYHLGTVIKSKEIFTIKEVILQREKT